MNYKTLVVINPKRNDTIYTYLRQHGYSENYLTNLRKNSQNVLCNGKYVFVNTKMKNEDILQINNSPNTSTSIITCDIPLNIVFEDDIMLIVNKPSGLSCMPNKAHYEHNLSGAIMHKYGKEFVLRIVNRLDKDTQGLVLISKTSLDYKPLFDSLQKTYHAIVCGQIKQPLTFNESIKNISENGRIKIKREVAPDGKNAITHVLPLKIFDHHTLIEAKIECGRTHQIRCHLSNAGFALLGDYIYGQESNIINHTALVCKTMTITHPQTNQMLHFEVEYEQSFANALKQIEKA